MCHRHLTFKKSSVCGHLILTDERQVDCQEPECYISSAHPSNCAARSARTRCWCRRYYTYVSSFRLVCPTHPPHHASQPERVEEPGLVSILSHFASPSSRSLKSSYSCQTNVQHVPVDLHDRFLVVPRLTMSFRVVS